jgi:hypothetical protein
LTASLSGAPTTGDRCGACAPSALGSVCGLRTATSSLRPSAHGGDGDVCAPRTRWRRTCDNVWIIDLQAHGPRPARTLRGHSCTTTTRSDPKAVSHDGGPSDPRVVVLEASWGSDHAAGANVCADYGSGLVSPERTLPPCVVLGLTTVLTTVGSPRRDRGRPSAPLLEYDPPRPGWRNGRRGGLKNRWGNPP